MSRISFGATWISVACIGLASAQEPVMLPPSPATSLRLGEPLTNVPIDPIAGVDNGRSISKFWVNAEYLLGWVKDGSSPPLVTTGTPTSGGILGLPGTRILNGDSLNYGTRSGGRFSGGVWLNCDATKGFELGYLFLNGNSKQFQANSSGTAGSEVLSRPYFNVISQRQDVELVAFPNVVGGTVRTSTGSRFQGADANFICNLCRYVPCPTTCCPTDCCQTDCLTNDFESYRVDFLVGPRWMQLNENLEIHERLTDINGNFFAVTDRFETRNNFYGAQVGLRGEWQRGRNFVSVFGKVALGVNHQEVRIVGSTIITQAGAGTSFQPGGLLAQPSNIGVYSRDQFSVIPEVGIRVGRQVTEHIRISLGYNFLYWSNVVRPGDQIDPVVNPTQLATFAGPGQLVGPARPEFRFKESDFWMQGISAGLQLSW